MKVTLILKKSVTRYDTESQATIYARLRDGRQLDLVAPTRLTINPNLWDDKAEQVKSKVVCDEAMRTRYNNEARRLKTYIERAYQNRPEETVSKGWLKEALDQYYNPQKYNLEQVSAIKPTLTALFDEFLEKHRLSEVRKKNYRVIKRALQRYELYIRATQMGKEDFTLDVDRVTACGTSGTFWKTSTATAPSIPRFTRPFPRPAHRNPEARTRCWTASRASEPSSIGATVIRRAGTGRSTISRWRSVPTGRRIISPSRSCTGSTPPI